jgi:hypothetical protein
LAEEIHTFGGKPLYFHGVVLRCGFALDASPQKTYYFPSRMVKSAGLASARKSEMIIFRLFYSPEPVADAVFSL